MTTPGIDAGVIAVPLVCGTLGEKVGWHWGFGAAGVGMAIGLAIYLAGQRYLPDEENRADRAAQRRAGRAPMAPGAGATIAVLLGLLPVLAAAIAGNMQIFNAYLLWGQATYDFQFLGRQLPTTWLVTLDAVVSVSFLFITVAFWRCWAHRHAEPDEITKIVIGAVISIFGLWCCGPRRSSSRRRACANNFVGWLGGFLHKMPGSSFWAVHVAIAVGAVGAVGAAIVRAIMRLAFRRQLAPTRAG